MRVLIIIIPLTFLLSCTEEITTEGATTDFVILQSGQNLGRQIKTVNFTTTNIFGLRETDRGFTYNEINYISPYPDFFQRNNYLTQTEINDQGFEVSRKQQSTGSTNLFTEISASTYTSDLSQIDNILELVNFGAEYDNGRISVMNNFDFEIELRMGPGISQKAHRYLVPETASSGVPLFFYTYADYVDVPFEVWDVTNNRQLMVAFRDQGRDGAFDLKTFDASSSPTEQSREYIFITSFDYDPINPEPLFSESTGSLIFANVQLWPVLAENGIWDPNNFNTVSVYRILIDTFQETVQYYPLFSNRAKYDIDEDFNFLIGDGALTSDSEPANHTLIYDETFRLKYNRAFDGRIYNNNISPLTGIKSTSDGGVLISTRNEDGFHLHKLYQDLSTQYELDLANSNDFNILDWVEFIEINGNYYFVTYHHADAPLLNFYQISQNGIELESTIELIPGTLPHLPIDFYPLSGNPVRVNIEAIGTPTFKPFTNWVNGCAYISTSGQLYLLDTDFQATNSPIQIEGFSPELAHNQFNIFHSNDDLIVTGVPEDNRSNFVLTRIDKDISVSQKVLELPSDIGIIQSSSFIRNDHSSAHILLIEKFGRVRELIFFQLDEDMEIIDIN